MVKYVIAWLKGITSYTPQYESILYQTNTAVHLTSISEYRIPNHFQNVSKEVSKLPNLPKDSKEGNVDFLSAIDNSHSEKIEISL